MSKPLTVKMFIEKPGAPDWDASKETYPEYCAKHCIAWDDLTPEDKEIMANKINMMGMTACGYVPVKEGAERSA